jgi:F0F1-type ATP synthase delta subunit
LGKYSKYFDLDNLEIKEDKKITGGYILKNKKYKVDNSYKKKLLNLYHKFTT